MAANDQVRLQPLHEGIQAQLLQASDVGLGEGCVNQVLKRRTPEHRERLTQALPRPLGIAGRMRRSGPVKEGLEALQVELAGLHAQPVPGRLGHQPGASSLVLEAAAKARDVGVQGGARAGRRGCSPQPLDELVAGDDPVAAEQQHCQGRPLLRPAERENAALIEDLERAEYPELQAAPLPATAQQPLCACGSRSLTLASSSLQGACKVDARSQEQVQPRGVDVSPHDETEDGMRMEPKKSSIALGLFLAVVGWRLLEDWGGGSGTTPGQAF